MKKALLMALCFMLASLLLVNGTFAADFGKAVADVFADLSEKLGDLVGKPIAGGDTVDVALVSDSSTQTLYPGGTATRTTHVHNQGSGDVYFRLAYAVQYDADTWDWLDIDFTPGDGFTEHDWQPITVGDTPFMMKVFTYTKALPAGEPSPKVQMSITMDASLTSQQVARYRSDFLQIQALAIETTAFEDRSAETALDMALPLGTLNPF